MASAIVTPFGRRCGGCCRPPSPLRPPASWRVSRACAARLPPPSGWPSRRPSSPKTRMSGPAAGRLELPIVSETVPARGRARRRRSAERSSACRCRYPGCWPRSPPSRRFSAAPALRPDGGKLPIVQVAMPVPTQPVAVTRGLARPCPPSEHFRARPHRPRSSFFEDQGLPLAGSASAWLQDAQIERIDAEPHAPARPSRFPAPRFRDPPRGAQRGRQVDVHALDLLRGREAMASHRGLSTRGWPARSIRPARPTSSRPRGGRTASAPAWSAASVIAWRICG